MSTAYLVARINSKTFKTIDVGIYSAPANQLAVHNETDRYIDLASATGHDFGSAHANMRIKVDRIPWSVPTVG